MLPALDTFTSLSDVGWIEVDESMIVSEVAVRSYQAPPPPRVAPIDTRALEAGLVAMGCKARQARDAVARAMRKAPRDLQGAMRAALAELTAGR